VTASVVAPSREALLQPVQQLLAQYSGTPVTVRQLYYRLVAAGTIPNTVRSYKNLVAALSVWRREKRIPFRAFEDRTRGLDRKDTGWRKDDPESWLSAWLKRAVEEAEGYHLARWHGQSKRVLVAVEKQALEGPFAEVCSELEVDLAVCRGYPSLSFLKEIADALSPKDPESDGRENVLLYFGDLDPSGVNIPETIDRDLGFGLFGRDFTLERIALTGEQVEDLGLIPAPFKLTDSRAGRFVQENGEDVYELDAIEPGQLQQLIRDSVNRHWDVDAEHAREDLVAKGRDLISSKLDESGIRDVIEELGE
jgi:hypothetical protein